jgi:hypothetical protein
LLVACRFSKTSGITRRTSALGRVIFLMGRHFSDMVATAMALLGHALQAEWKLAEQRYQEGFRILESQHALESVRAHEGVACRSRAPDGKALAARVRRAAREVGRRVSKDIG